MQPLVLLFFSNLFSTDMILIIIVALVLFGGDKLPELARGLGKGIRDFKDASEGVKREITNQINNYEEKRPELPVVETPPVIEPQLELPSATEEHTIAEAEVAVHETTVPHPIEEIQGVPNTIPYNDNHGAVSESQVNGEHHPEESATETKTESVKTTH